MAEMVSLGNAIARKATRKLHSLGYTLEQLSSLSPKLRDADEIGIREKPEVATSVGPLRTMALRARARELTSI